MKRTWLLIPGCAFWLLAGCRTGQDGEQSLLHLRNASGGESTNSFGIYLTGARVDPAVASRDLSSVPLKSPPIISDADILAVDLTNGLMKPKREVFKRLPAPSVEGTQFLAVADGERIFLGAFWTHLSSSSPGVNATIGLDWLPGQNYLCLGWFDPKSGRGGSGLWLGKEESPGDLWSDPRIKRCLGKLHKLGHVNP